jgi:hypothetical protein
VIGGLKNTKDAQEAQRSGKPITPQQYGESAGLRRIIALVILADVWKSCNAKQNKGATGPNDLLPLLAAHEYTYY